MNLDKGTAKRILEESEPFKDFRDPQPRDEYFYAVTSEWAMAFATALLKEAQAGNEAAWTCDDINTDNIDKSFEQFCKDNLHLSPIFAYALKNTAPPAKEAQAGNEAVVMGYGNYAVGCCKDPETDIEGVIYLPLSEPREVGADTSDLFPIGSSQEGYKALIYFKDSKAIQQTIEYLQSISYYKPPVQEVEALKAALQEVKLLVENVQGNNGAVLLEIWELANKTLKDPIDNTDELQEPNTGIE